MANRGKSSARPVCLDGLQILAESRSSGRKKAASPTFDKVRFIHKANEFLLILTEKGLRISINTKVSSKNRQLDNCWLNPDNLNVNWQALFCDSFHATQQLPRFVLIRGNAHLTLLWVKLCGLSCNICINYHTRANKGRGLYSKNILWPVIAANNRERLLIKNYFPDYNVHD